MTKKIEPSGTILGSAFTFSSAFTTPTISRYTSLAYSIPSPPRNRRLGDIYKYLFSENRHCCVLQYSPAGLQARFATPFFGLSFHAVYGFQNTTCSCCEISHLWWEALAACVHALDLLVWPCLYFTRFFYAFIAYECSSGVLDVSNFVFMHSPTIFPHSSWHISSLSPGKPAARLQLLVEMVLSNRTIRLRLWISNLPVHVAPDGCGWPVFFYQSC